MQKLKALLDYAEGRLLAFLKLQLPVLHTAWQGAFGVLVAGLLASKSSSDAKLALAAALATFLAALKAAYLSYRN
jgi:hypothetical protein